MAIFKQYRCDGCGADKREANHWWALGIDGRNLILGTLESYESGCNELLSPWPDAAMILCGQDCVTKKISAFMGAQVRASDSQADGVKG